MMLNNQKLYKEHAYIYGDHADHKKYLSDHYDDLSISYHNMTSKYDDDEEEICLSMSIYYINIILLYMIVNMDYEILINSLIVVNIVWTMKEVIQQQQQQQLLLLLE